MFVYIIQYQLVAVGELRRVLKTQLVQVRLYGDVRSAEVRMCDGHPLVSITSGAILSTHLAQVVHRVLGGVGRVLPVFVVENLAWYC